MYEENKLSCSKGGLAVGIGLGLLSGVASTIWYHRKKVLSADQAPENIKLSFLKEGAIESSWISFEKEPIRKSAVRSSAYRGGFSRIEDGEAVYYKFLTDAHTGTVLGISRKGGAIDQYVKEVKERICTHYPKERYHVLLLQWMVFQVEFSKHILQYFLFR